MPIPGPAPTGTKISDLPAVTTAAGTDEFAVNQGGVSLKETLNQIREFGIPSRTPGTISLSIEDFLLQYDRLTLVSTDRVTLTSTARIVLQEFGNSGPNYVGVPKIPTSPFTVPDGYALDISNGRLTLVGLARAILEGSADLILSDDFRQRSRIVLSGYGG